MIETKKNIARQKIKNGSYGNWVWVCRPNYLAQDGDEQLSVFVLVFVFVISLRSASLRQVSPIA